MNLKSTGHTIEYAFAAPVYDRACDTWKVQNERWYWPVQLQSMFPFENWNVQRQAASPVNLLVYTVPKNCQEILEIPMVPFRSLP